MDFKDYLGWLIRFIDDTYEYRNSELKTKLLIIKKHLKGYNIEHLIRCTRRKTMNLKSQRSH